MEEKSKQERRNIPVAYVTQWATTRGVLVVRSGEYVPRDGGEDGYLSKGHLFVSPKHWTEDREIAIQRWRKMLRAKIASHNKAIAALGESLMGEPTFEEETP